MSTAKPKGTKSPGKAPKPKPKGKKGKPKQPKARALPIGRPVDSDTAREINALVKSASRGVGRLSPETYALTARIASGGTRDYGYTPVLPALESMGGNMFMTSRFTEVIEIPIFPTLNVLPNLSITGPTLFAGLEVDIFPRAFAFPVVQLHDLYTAAVFPLYMNSSGSSTRVWSSGYTQNDYFVQQAMTTQPSALQTGTLSTASAFYPSGTTERFVTTLVTEDLPSTAFSGCQYFWVDSSSAAPATLSVTLNWSKTLAATTSIGLILYYWTSSGPNNLMQLASTSSGALNGNETVTGFLAKYAGYYAFQYYIITSAATAMSFTAHVQVTESTNIGTVFFNNPNASLIPDMGDNAYLVASSTVLSPIFCTTVADGTCFGLRADTLEPYWPAALSSAPNIANRAPSSEKYMGGSGGPLTKGIYAYGSPSVWRSSLQSTHVVSKVATTPTGISTDSSSPISLLLPARGQSPGVKIMWLTVNLSGVATTPSIALKIASSFHIEVVPQNNLVRASPAAMLLPDEWAMIRRALCTTDQFTCNPGHWMLAAAVGKALGQIALEVLAPHALDALKRLAAWAGEKLGVVSKPSERLLPTGARGFTWQL